MKRPVVAIALSLMAGISIAHKLDIPVIYLFGISGGLLVASLVFMRKKALSDISLLLCFLLLGALSLKIQNTLPPNHISRFIDGSGEKAILAGTVVSGIDKEVLPYGRRRIAFDVNSEDLFYRGRWHRALGRVRTDIIRNIGQKEGNSIRYGDRVAVSGFLSLPRGLSNPAGFDYGRFLEGKGIYAVFSARPLDRIHILTAGGSFRRRLFALRERISEASKRYIPDPEGAVFRALILGDRSDIAWQMKDAFINTGTVHILAISGLHIGLIVVLLIGILNLSGIPLKVSYALTIPLIIAYAAFVGARPPVVRAVIMAVIFMAGFTIKRRADVYNSLGLAAIILLILDPRSLFDAGFQLSFTAVLSILYLTPRIEVLMREKLGFYLSRYIAVTVSAALGVMPLVILYFNTVSLSAFLANIAVIPLVFFIILIGLPFAFIALVMPAGFASAILGKGLWAAIYILIEFISALSNLPYSFFKAASPSPIFIALYYVFVIIFFERERFRIPAGRVSIALLILLNIPVWSSALRPASDKMKVTFFDVGHGDSAFIEFPGEQNLLVDTGQGGDNDSARWVIAPYLWQKGIRDIDAVLLTHADRDHTGGLGSILRNFRVRNIYFNGLPAALPWQGLKEGRMIRGYNGAGIYVLNPPDGYIKSESMDNDNSAVIKVVYNRFSVLLCGDIEDAGIRNILRYGRLLESTVLKLPHHGRNRSGMNDALLDAAKADIYVASSLGRADEAYLDIDGLYDTSQSGAITITSDGVDYWIETIKGNNQYPNTTNQITTN